MRLEGRVAIVTGAGRGIGRQIASRFGQEGASIVVNDVEDGPGKETVDLLTARGIQAIFVRGDVGNRTDARRIVRAALDRFGTVDILVNNAMCSVRAILRNEWEPVMSVGLMGPWLLTQEVLPTMRKHRRGVIINISSVNALAGFGTEHVYSAAKAGLIGLSRSLAVQEGRHGIRINCICPGTIVTPAWRQIEEQSPGVLDRIKTLYPIGRLGKPEDVAAAAAFLASDEASFITGAVLVVDGGLTAGNLAFGTGAPEEEASGG